MNLNLLAALYPMLCIDPLAWRGLPRATVAEFDALFGVPGESVESFLGYYPATRHHYFSAVTAQGLVLWARAGEAIMVETAMPPPAAMLASLSEPSAVLAPEIFVADSYAHEYLYCGTGLVLTVTQALGGEVPRRIVRCRGVKVLDSAEEFGPTYYRPLQDQMRWAAEEQSSKKQLKGADIEVSPRNTQPQRD